MSVVVVEVVRLMVVIVGNRVLSLLSLCYPRSPFMGLQQL